MHSSRQQTVPAVIWLTGLSASGKTTIAGWISDLFKTHHIVPVLLDGDEIRQVMQTTGFDEQSRRKHNLNVGKLAALLEGQGHVVIVSMIAPYRDVRNAVRAMCSRFMEVYIATDLATCIQRDPKGLYKKALAGEIKEFTGVSAIYEAPFDPELSIDTCSWDAQACAQQIFNVYKGVPALF
jgi:adenylylsulfate kinase